MLHTINRSLFASALLLASFAAAAACSAPDGCSLERGKKIFMTCAGCHSVDPSGSFTTGPNLRAALGRPIGKAPGFQYSAALQKATGVWTPAKLETFLAAPNETFPGTSMAFAGLKKPDDREAVVNYLKSMGETGK